MITPKQMRETNPETYKMKLQTLPTDIITEVCKHLNVRDISSLYYTDTTLQDAIADNSNYLQTICQRIQPHGLVRTWRDEEKTVIKTESYYSDGERNGKCRHWYANGNLCYDLFYVRGKLHGEAKYWHENGELYGHRFYVNGKKNGKFTLWCSDGQIYGHRFYVNDKLHGEYKIWSKNGQLGEHCFYVDGKLHGEYKLWHDNGNLSEHAFYVQGKPTGQSLPVTPRISFRGRR